MSIALFTSEESIEMSVEGKVMQVRDMISTILITYLEMASAGFGISRKSGTYLYSHELHKLGSYVRHCWCIVWILWFSTGILAGYISSDISYMNKAPS